MDPQDVATKDKAYFLRQIDLAYQQMQLLEEQYRENHEELKSKIAEVIEKGKFEADLSIQDVADHLGKTRQAVHRIIVQTYGVRHEDKAEAARIGHLSRTSYKGE